MIYSNMFVLVVYHQKKKYRKSIIQNTEKILKEKYDVDLGKIFMEVKESE